MNIDNLTIGEARQIAAVVRGLSPTPEPEENHGLCIVVLDRGFVYVGTLITGANWLTIDNARNIRRWGTTKGLGQLALEGPQLNTVLDNVGTVQASITGLKHFLICEVGAWKN